MADDNQGYLARLRKLLTEEEKESVTLSLYGGDITYEGGGETEWPDYLWELLT